MRGGVSHQVARLRAVRGERLYRLLYFYNLMQSYEHHPRHAFFLTTDLTA